MMRVEKKVRGDLSFLVEMGAERRGGCSRLFPTEMGIRICSKGSTLDLE